MKHYGVLCFRAEAAQCLGEGGLEDFLVLVLVTDSIVPKPLTLLLPGARAEGRDLGFKHLPHRRRQRGGGVGLLEGVGGEVVVFNVDSLAGHLHTAVSEALEATVDVVERVLMAADASPRVVQSVTRCGDTRAFMIGNVAFVLNNVGTAAFDARTIGSRFTKVLQQSGSTPSAGLRTAS